jgi:hypothetical protein
MLLRRQCLHELMPLSLGNCGGKWWLHSEVKESLWSQSCLWWFRSGLSVLSPAGSVIYRNHSCTRNVRGLLATPCLKHTKCVRMSRKLYVGRGSSSCNWICSCIIIQLSTCVLLLSLLDGSSAIVRLVRESWSESAGSSGKRVIR